MTGFLDVARSRVRFTLFLGLWLCVPWPRSWVGLENTAEWARCFILHLRSPIGWGSQPRNRRKKIAEISRVEAPKASLFPRQPCNWRFIAAYQALFPHAGRWLNEASQRLVVVITATFYPLSDRKASRIRANPRRGGTCWWEKMGAGPVIWTSWQT